MQSKSEPISVISGSWRFVRGISALPKRIAWRVGATYVDRTLPKDQDEIHQQTSIAHVSSLYRICVAIALSSLRRVRRLYASSFVRPFDTLNEERASLPHT